MADEDIELEITPTGLVRTIYKDDRLELFDAFQANWKIGVKRASNVEWEELDGQSGWTVRAAHDPELAIREGSTCLSVFRVSKQGKIVLFPTREMALQCEVHNFFNLLPKEDK